MSAAGWSSAFPQQSAQMVVSYLVGVWNQLTAHPSPHFGWHLKEPNITKRFKQHLENGSETFGLSGMWVAENVSMDLHPVTGAPSNENRTDILYFSDCVHPSLRLTFEFKKLKDTSHSRKAYFGAQGMGRFLSGTYAKTVPFGLMVAIIEKGSQRACVDKLKRSLRGKTAHQTLLYVSGDPNKCLTDPSMHLTGMAEFDTEHQRVMSGFQTFLFSHLVLAFPPHA